MGTWAKRLAVIIVLAATTGVPGARAQDAGDLLVDPAGLVPAVRGERTQVASLPPRPTCAPGALVRGVDVGAARVIAFSFDDGPWPSNTGDVMSTFEARGLRATFFMIGNNVARFPDIARSVVGRGHEVANHSMTHQYSPSTIAREIRPANDLIESVTGVRPRLFRSPGLNQGDGIQAELASQHMCNIFTTVDLHDSISPRRSSSTLCASFAGSLHPGEIVLLHDGGTHRPTVDAVPCMLHVAAGRGYAVVTVGELLSMGPTYSSGRPQRAQRTSSAGREDAADPATTE